MPADFTNCVFHLKADELTTLSTSAVAASPADGSMANNGVVRSWYDSRGSSFTFSNATGAVYKTGGLNGKPYIDFPSAGDNSGPLLTERSTALSTTITGSYTVMMLVDYREVYGSFNTFFTNSEGGGGYSFLMYLGAFTRFNGTCSAPLPAGVHAVIYQLNKVSASTGTETIYVDSAIATDTDLSTLSGPSVGPYVVGNVPNGSQCSNSRYYEVLVFGSDISGTTIAGHLADWNTKYATTFNTSVGPLAAGSGSASNVSKTTQTIAFAASAGGTSPYTTQIYRSTVNGTAASIAVVGNAVAGATGLVLNDTGLTVQTPYYYVLKLTDSVAGVSLSPVLTAPTHGPTTVKFQLLGDSTTFGSTSGTDPVAHFILKGQELFPALDVQASNGGSGGRKMRDLSRVAHATGTQGGSGITSIITGLNAATITRVSLCLGLNDYDDTDETNFSAARYDLDIRDVTSALTAANITVYVNNIGWGGAGRDNASTGLPERNAIINALPYAGLLRVGDRTHYALGKNTTPTVLTDGTHWNFFYTQEAGYRWAAVAVADSVPAPTPTVTSVTVTPSAPTVQPLATQQFTAAVVVTNGASQAVAWSKVSGVGTISGTGLYTAPAGIVGTAQAAVIRGASTFDATKFSDATITIPALPAPAPATGAAIYHVIMAGDFPQTATITPYRLTAGDTAGGIGLALTDDSGGAILFAGSETVTFNLRAVGTGVSVIDDAPAAFFAQERTGVRLVRFSFSPSVPVPPTGNYEATFVVGGVTYPLGRKQPVRIQEQI